MKKVRVKYIPDYKIKTKKQAEKRAEQVMNELKETVTTEKLILGVVEKVRKLRKLTKNETGRVELQLLVAKESWDEILCNANVICYLGYPVSLYGVRLVPYAGSKDIGIVTEYDEEDILAISWSVEL